MCTCMVTPPSLSTPGIQFFKPGGGGGSTIQQVGHCHLLLSGESHTPDGCGLPRAPSRAPPPASRAATQAERGMSPGSRVSAGRARRGRTDPLGRSP